MWLACGFCVEIAPLFPLAFYWTLAFLLWAIPFGIPLAVAAAAKEEELPVHPLPYLLAWPVALSLGLIGLGPSLVSVIFVAIWATRLALRVETPHESGSCRVLSVAASTRRIFLVVLLALVPLSYMRMWLFVPGIVMFQSWEAHSSGSTEALLTRLRLVG